MGVTVFSLVFCICRINVSVPDENFLCSVPAMKNSHTTFWQPFNYLMTASMHVVVENHLICTWELVLNAQQYFSFRENLSTSLDVLYTEELLIYKWAIHTTANH